MQRIKYVLLAMVVASLCAWHEAVDLPPTLDIDLVYVEGGRFAMGCTNEQWQCYKNEKPVREVRVSSFYIARYEVTQRQWQHIMGNNPSEPKKCPDCAVNNVSWVEVQRFIAILNQKTGKNYRLPTEAEWEFAARGGLLSKGHRYAGSEWVDEVAEYEGNNNLAPRPVGKKRPNELGIYDMSGNVREWCSDWYGDYAGQSLDDPQGPSSGEQRVLRGGACTDTEWTCRVSNRQYSSPILGLQLCGFRLALRP